jgi:hypothetical protein
MRVTSNGSPLRFVRVAPSCLAGSRSRFFAHSSRVIDRRTAGALGQAEGVDLPLVTRPPPVAGSATVDGIMRRAAWAVTGCAPADRIGITERGLWVVRTHSDLLRLNVSSLAPAAAAVRR